jgi:hypothetical protein
MSTSPNTLESILGPNLEQVLRELEDIFPPVTATPDNSLSQIMYKSGQRSVVEWITQRISKD